MTIVRALGAVPRYLKAELMAQAADLLAAEGAERHRRVVLICDLCRHRDYADAGLAWLRRSQRSRVFG